MPPKQAKGKAAKSLHDSDYQESEPEHEMRPRLTLKYDKSLLNKNQTVDPKRALAGTRDLPPDPIYQRLLSPATDKSTTVEKQRVDAGSPRSSAFGGQSPQDFFHNYTKKLIWDEIEKQASTLDWSVQNSIFEESARVYGKFLFTAPHQSKKTKKLWFKEAVKRVGAMSVADIADNGIASEVKEAMIDTIKRSCQLQAVEFATSTRSLISKIREQE